MTTPIKPVVRVQIGGESRPVRFGFNALATFNDLTGTTLADLQSTFAPPPGLSEAERAAWQPPLKAGDVLALVYAGLDDGARKEKLPRDFDADDVGDWLDEADGSVLGEVFAAFAGAQGDADEETPGKRKTKAT